MALGAVALDRETGLAIMAGAAGFALLHLLHGYRFAATIGEDLGVAVAAFVGCGVEVVAEEANHGTTVVFESQVGWFEANMAFVTVT